MAREELDREDLLAEATALVERIELALAPWNSPVVAGFRRGGELSLYFGQDPALHFSVAGLLRRGFVSGDLYKAEAGRWVRLSRRRGPQEVALVSRPLDQHEQAKFLQETDERLTALERCLAAGHFRVVGQVPDAADVVGRLLAWLGARPRPLAVAHAPGVRR